MKWTLWFLDKGPDHFQREIKLANAVLSLAPRNFVRIIEKWRRFGNTMPVIGHATNYSPACSFLSSAATISRVIRSFSMWVLP